MGSGMSGLYTGTRGQSQPYASSYSVLPALRIWDREQGIYGENGYNLNPTAQPLQKLLEGNYIGGKQTNTSLLYVIDMKGNIIVGSRHGNGARGEPTPHPTLIGGKNPKVQAAGVLNIRGGKIYSYDDRSGHYKPNERSMDIANAIFNRLSYRYFHKTNLQKRL